VPDLNDEPDYLAPAKIDHGKLTNLGLGARRARPAVVEAAVQRCIKRNVENAIRHQGPVSVKKSVKIAASGAAFALAA
jgi:hypothetical protein